MSDSVIDLYRRHGLAWARERETQSDIETAWLDQFRSLLVPGVAVLDLGCGSGVPIARHLTEHGFAVTGVDTAPDLLAQCRTRLPGTWHEADMRTLDLGRSFGGILAWNSFFHLVPADQRLMFAVFRRHASPGAPLMFTSGPAAGEAIGQFAGEPLYHASLAPAEYRALLTANGFTERAHIAEDPACHGHTVWLAQAEAQTGSAVHGRTQAFGQRQSWMAGISMPCAAI